MSQREAGRGGAGGGGREGGTPKGKGIKQEEIGLESGVITLRRLHR